MINFSYSTSHESQPFEQSTLEVLDNAFDNFLKVIDSKEIGFFRIPNQERFLSTCHEIHQRFHDRKHFVQIGIGGSSLGPEMLITSLAQNKNKFTFINNIDPDKIYEQLEGIEIKNCLFYVVSKSGGTAETVAGAAIVMNLLKEQGLSESDFKDYFVFATDPQKSQLLELSKELNISTLEVPSDVGGRFSVMTPVGLLPALFAGINIEELFKGAKEISSVLIKKEDNPLKEMANYLWAEYKTGKTQTVILPYSSKLRDLAFWYVQLWAESLGKEKNRKGEKVETGLTPIPGYGATDQHSQMQLFMEGPRDKVLLLLEVEKFNHDFKLASGMKLPSFEKLEKFTLSQLMKAELEGTKKALTERNRPFTCINIPVLDAFHLGQCIQFFEALTALMGEYFEIDAFDQPGVELGKVYAYEYLSTL